MTHDVFLYALKHAPVPQGQTLWLYGEPGIAACDIYQPWHGPAARLEKQGCRVFSNLDATQPLYDAVFVNCPKQHDETEGLLAFALAHSSGFVMAGAANDAGGGRLAGMMESYGLIPERLSKNHAKIVWTLKAPKADKKIVEQKLNALKPREVMMEGKPYVTLPGLFGWDRIDAGSRLLMQHLPEDITGRVADFGCGYGYLSCALEERYPGIISIDAFDADARAVACCIQNAPKLTKAIWQDVTTMESKPMYDAVVMNPPFHQGKREERSLGELFIRQAMKSLRAGGRFFLVANRHLPYEGTLPGMKILYEGEGYKIMTGRAL